MDEATKAAVIQMQVMAAFWYRNAFHARTNADLGTPDDEQEDTLAGARVSQRIAARYAASARALVVTN